MEYDAIPQELKALKRWGVFKKIWKPERGKYTKIPYDAETGKEGRSNDESTWTDFATALTAFRRDEEYAGLAFFFKPPYIGIDLDHVKDDIDRMVHGDVGENIVYDFVSAMKSYTEVSLSGEGIHIIIKGTLPEGKRRKGEIEMYDSGRFFALTGNSFNKINTINQPPDKVFHAFYAKYINSESNVIQMAQAPQYGVSDLSINQIIADALQSKTGNRFKMLMNGKWEGFYDSQSEADLAFANDLAFWTAKDFGKMDTIFRQSGLMRDKYDEKHGKVTYGVGLLNKAIAGTNSVYEPREKQSSFSLIVPGLTDDDPDLKNKRNKETGWYSYDDTGNAQRFVDRFGKVVKYDTISGRFMFFDGHVWREDKTRVAQKMLNDVVESLKDEPLHVPKEGGKDAEEAAETARAKFIKRSRNNSGKRAAINEIESLTATTTDAFDTELNVLNTPSGYIDLSTGELKDTTPKDMFTKITNYEYSDTYEAPRWEEFLNQVFDGNDELIHFIQKLVGYTMTGTMDEQVMVILHGEKKKNGSNGKSVFVETLSDVVGNYAINIQPETIMAKPFSNTSGPNNDIARMKGARLITSSEPDDGMRLSEGLVKQLTGGDKVTARKLYGDYFEFVPTGTIWISTNHKPLVRGTDDGIWRRLLFVPFLVQIPNDKKDPKLKQKLLREGPGILNWAVDGALMWQREGLHPPEIVRQDTNAYREEMDTIGSFLNEVAEQGPGFTCTFADVSRTFDCWERINGTGITKNKLGRELTQRFGKKHVKGYVNYIGLRIKREYKEFEQSYNF